MAKRKRRRFTAEFKAEVVLEALRGESSQAELCRRHHFSEDPLSTWKRRLLENAVTLFESPDKQSNTSLKEEEVHLNAYEDITDASARIGHFIAQVYHQKRPHSALGYLTLVDFEQQYLS